MAVANRELSFDEVIERLCVLEDPARRSAYLAIRSATRPLTRGEVADAAGISTRLAAFHLEKLVEQGYLEATYPPQRRRGQIGHPAKQYRLADLQLEVSMPPRRYDLVAEIVVEALARRPTGCEAADLDAAADACGRRVGARVPAGRGEPRFMTALRMAGYEPVSDDDTVVLRNCPFHRAAQAQPEVVCRINRSFVTGLLAGTRARSRSATLDPTDGRCCVLVTRRPDTAVDRAGR